MVPAVMSPVVVMATSPEPLWVAETPMAAESRVVMVPPRVAVMVVAPAAVVMVRALPVATLNMVLPRSRRERGPEATAGVAKASEMVPEQTKEPAPWSSQLSVGAPTAERSQLPVRESRRSSSSLASMPVTRSRVTLAAELARSPVKLMRVTPVVSMFSAVPVACRLMVRMPARLLLTVRVSAASAPALRAMLRVILPPLPARSVMVRESLVELLARETAPVLVRRPAMVAVLAILRVPALVILPVMVVAPVVWSCALEAMVVVVARRWAALRLRVPVAMVAVVKLLSAAWVPVRVKVLVPVLSRSVKPVKSARAAREKVPAPARLRVASVRSEVTAPVMAKPVSRVRVWVLPPVKAMAAVVPVMEPAREMAMLLLACSVSAAMAVAAETEAPVLMLMARSPAPSWAASMPMPLLVERMVPLAAMVMVVAAALVVLISMALPPASALLAVTETAPVPWWRR